MEELKQALVILLVALVEIEMKDGEITILHTVNFSHDFIAQCIFFVFQSLTQKPNFHENTSFSWIYIYILGDPKKYSCLIKRKMHKKRGIFKMKIVLNYQ